jgi:hypothetical protein
MNLNLINLDYTEWSRADWTDAYTAYCKTNLFGPMSKREYYDWVRSRLDRQKSVAEPLSEDLVAKWTNGFKNASVWAKKRKCNMNGVALESCRPEINLEELQNDVKDIQWQLTNKGV